MGVPSINRNFRIEVQGYAMLIFLPQFRTNVSLFEFVICLVPAKLWNFLEARILYNKCIRINCGFIPLKSYEQTVGEVVQHIFCSKLQMEKQPDIYKQDRHFNRTRKSCTTLQNKVRLKVLPEQLTLFVNTSVTFKKCIIQ